MSYWSDHLGGVAVLELGVDTRKSKVVTARLRKGHSDKEPTTLTCLLMAGLRSGPGDSLKRLGFQVKCLEVVCRTGLPSLTSVQMKSGQHKLRIESVRCTEVVNLKIKGNFPNKHDLTPWSPIHIVHHGPTPGLGGHQGSGMMGPRYSPLLRSIQSDAVRCRARAGSLPLSLVLQDVLCTVVTVRTIASTSGYLTGLLVLT